MTGPANSPTSSGPDSRYRFAGPLVARLVGAGLLVLAVLLVVVTVLVALLHGPADIIVVVGLLGLAVVLGGAGWLRAQVVVRLDDDGYRVRLIRGVGEAARAWTDVERAVATDPGGVDCLVLRLKDGASTTIPVETLDGDRDAFAHDVRERLQAAVRRR